jgi:hypothetical protein
VRGTYAVGSIEGVAPKVSQVLYNKLMPLSQAIYYPSMNFVALVPKGLHKLPKLEQLHVDVSILTDPMGGELNNGKNFTATVTSAGLVVSPDRITTAVAETPITVAIDALFEQEMDFSLRGVRQGP